MVWNTCLVQVVISGQGAEAVLVQVSQVSNGGTVDLGTWQEKYARRQSAPEGRRRDQHSSGCGTVSQEGTPWLGWALF